MASRERDDAMAGLLKRNLAGDAGAGNDCPEPEILAAYFEQSLDAGETARTELHLSECARCREQFAAQSRAEAEAPVSSVADARRKSPRASWMWDWRWLAPVAAVLVITAIWATRRPALNQIAEQPTQAPIATRAPAPAPAPERQPIQFAAQQAAPEDNEKTAPRKIAAPPNGATRILQPAPASSASAMDSTAGAPAANMEKSERQNLVTPKAIENPPLDSRDTELKKLPESPSASKSGATDQVSNAPAPAVTSESVTAQAESSTIATTAAAPASPQNSNGAAGGTASGAASANKQSSNAKEKPALMSGFRARSEIAIANQAGELSAENVIRTPDPKILWRIASGGFVERSEDGGLTWMGQLPNQNAHFTAGSAPGAKVCWLVGDDGIILLTQDAANWQTIPPPRRADFVAVSAPNASSATVTAADGRKFTTPNRGKTWKPAE
ncbi:MAG: hypothetical protein WA369_00415 [Candidatus Acidiferrales bacterium]